MYDSNTAYPKLKNVTIANTPIGDDSIVICCRKYLSSMKNI